MDAIKKAVSEGRRTCSFFSALAEIVRGWDGDVNGTQAYVFEEHLLVLLKIRSHQKVGEDKVPCALAVYANVAADRLAGAGGDMASVEDIMWPAGGLDASVMVGGSASVQYVSKAMRNQGFGQALRRLSGLGQQGAASQLFRDIGWEYKYYCFTGTAWGESALSQFRDKLFGNRLTGGELKAHGRVQSGTCGVVRVWVWHPWTYKLMQSVGYSEEAQATYAEGGDQVCSNQFICSHLETL